MHRIWLAALALFAILAPSSVAFAVDFNYTVTTAYGTVSDDDTGTYAEDTSITTTVPATVAGATNTRYRCTGYTGTGSAPATGATNTVTFTITEDSSVTFAWITQYYCTFQTSPASVGALSAFSATGHWSDWYDIGASLSTTVPSQVTESSTIRWNATSISSSGMFVWPSGNTSVFVGISTPCTITFNYTEQCYFAVSTTQGTLSGSATGWYDAGTSLSATVSQNVDITANQSRYNCTGFSGTGDLGNASSNTTGSFSLTQPTTVSFAFVVQYYYGVTIGHGTLTGNGSGWYDTGTSLITTAQQTVDIVTNQSRYNCTGFTGTGNLSAWGTTNTTGQFTLTQYTTMAFTWNTQYYFSISAGTAAPAITGSTSNWYNSGTTLTSSVPQTVTIVTDQSRYNCSGFTATGSLSSGSGNSFSFTIGSYTTAVFNWTTQYYYTVSSPNSGINGNGAGWYNAGTNISSSVPQTVAIATGSRYNCEGFTGTGSAPASGAGITASFSINSYSTVTFLWDTQYQYTVTSIPQVTPTGDGSGWYDTGTALYTSVNEDTYVSGTTWYNSTGFTGTGDLSDDTENSTGDFTLTQPTTVTFQFDTKYYYTAESVYLVTEVGTLTGDLEGWYLAGTSLQTSIDQYVVYGSNQRYYCTGFTGTGNLSAGGSTNSTGSFAISQPTTCSFQWQIQYYYTVSVGSAPATVTGNDSGWYAYGSTLSTTVPSVVYDPGNSLIRYQCTGFGGSGSAGEGEENTTGSFEMTAVTNVNFFWNKQYFHTLSFNPAAVATTSGTFIYDTYSGNNGESGWYNSNSSFGGWYGTIVPHSNSSSQWRLDSINHTGGTLNSQFGVLTEDPNYKIAMLTPSGPGTITFNYVLQHYYTVNSGNAGATVTGDPSGWYDTGTSLDSSVNQLIVITDGESRYNCSGFTGTGNLAGGGTSNTTDAFSLTQPTTVTFTWMVQYYFTAEAGAPGASIIGSVSGWYAAGGILSCSVSQTVNILTGQSRYYNTGFTGTGNLAGGGSSNSTGSFQINQASSVLFSWKTQYWYSVSSIAQVPPSGNLNNWYDSGASLATSVPSSTTIGGTRFDCIGYSGTGDLSSGGTASSVSLTISQSSSVSFLFDTYYQYTVTSDYSEISGDTSGWYLLGTELSSSVPEDVLNDEGDRWHAEGFIGTGNLSTTWSGYGTGSFIITTDTTADFKWQRQYYYEVVVEPAEVLDEPEFYTYYDWSGWYDEGSYLWTFVPDIVDIDEFNRWRIDPVQTSGGYFYVYDDYDVELELFEPSVLTFTYIRQYYYEALTEQAEVEGSQTGWYDDGTELESFVTTPTEGVEGTRYDCRGFVAMGALADSIETTTGTFELTEPTSVLFVWMRQYWYEVTSGRESVPLVGDVDGWYDENTELSAAVQLHDYIIPGWERWECRGYNATGAIESGSDIATGTFELTTSTTIEFIWTRQLFFELIPNEGEPVVTSTPSGWYDEGTVISSSALAIYNVVSGERYIFVDWVRTHGEDTDGGSVPIVPDTEIMYPMTITWHWQHQFHFEVSTAHGQLFGPTTGWFNAGTYISVGVVEPILFFGVESRWICRNYDAWGSVGSGEGHTVAFDITVGTSVTFLWISQHYLDVNTNFGHTTPDDGWYDEGLVIEINAIHPETVEGERYVWMGWDGTGASSITTQDGPVLTVTMNSPIKQNGIFVHEWYLTLIANGGSFNYASGWYEHGTLVDLTATPPISVPGQRFKHSWQGIGEYSQSYPLSDNTPNPIYIDLRGAVVQEVIWHVQYRLSVLNPTGLGVCFPAPGDHWYYPGTQITASMTPYDGDKQVVGFSGTGSVQSAAASNVTFIINMPSQLIWNWQLRPESEQPEWRGPYYTEIPGNLGDMWREDNGNPWLAFYDADNQLIKVAVPSTGAGKTDMAANNWQSEILAAPDTVVDALKYTATDDGARWILWHEVNGKLVLARFDGVWTYFTISNTTDKGIALIARGDMVHFAWRERADHKIRATTFADGEMYHEEVDQINSEVVDLELARHLDTDFGWLAYVTKSEKLVVITNMIEGLERTQLSDRAKAVALALDPGGLPFVGEITRGETGGFARMHYISMGQWNYAFHPEPVSTHSIAATADPNGDGALYIALWGTLIRLAWNGLEFTKVALDSGLEEGDFIVANSDAAGNVGILYSAIGKLRYTNYKSNSISLPPSVNIGDGGAIVDAGGGGCFVATAAFGQLTAESVTALTAARDGALNSSATTATLTGLYYAVSPELADSMRDSQSVRAILRKLLAN